MSSLDGTPKHVLTAETTGELAARPQDSVVSFETAQGSVYTYGEDGRTTRFKAATDEQMEAQDITVFADLTVMQQGDISMAYLAGDFEPKTKIYIVERQPDDSPKIIRKITDIQRQNELYLAIFRDGVMTENIPAWLFPKVGSNVFDMRHFQQDGVEMTERHLGNKITEINYKGETSVQTE